MSNSSVVVGMIVLFTGTVVKIAPSWLFRGTTDFAVMIFDFFQRFTERFRDEEMGEYNHQQ